MKLTINIDAKGNLPGTLGWFRNHVANSKLEIRGTKDSAPGLFMVSTEENPEYDPIFICGKEANPHDFGGYRNNGDDFIWVHPTSSGHDGEINGLTARPLTDACYSAVRDFINEAKKLYLEWWDNDGKDEQDYPEPNE